MTKWVDLTKENDIIRLQIKRGGGNALNRRLIDEFSNALSEVEQLTDIRGLVIYAEGDAFSVGGDIQHFVEHAETLDNELQYMAGLMQSCVSRLAQLPIPVVIGVHKAVGGGALGLLWSADYVFASPGTRFATGFVDIGLSGDGGSSWYLPRLIGLRRAKEMLLENKIIDAQQAVEWGLINHIVDQDVLVEQCMKKARAMAARSLVSIGAFKKLLKESPTNSLQQQLDLELDTIIGCARKKDVKAGIEAFLERRKPVFKDR